MPRLWGRRSASVTSLASSRPPSARERLKRWRSRASLRSSYLESLQAEEPGEIFMFVEGGDVSDDDEAFCIVEHDPGSHLAGTTVDVNTRAGTFPNFNNDAGRLSPSIVVSTPHAPHGHFASRPFLTSFAPPFSGSPKALAAGLRSGASSTTLPNTRLDPTRLMPLSRGRGEAFAPLSIDFDSSHFAYGESEDETESNQIPGIDVASQSRTAHGAPTSSKASASEASGATTMMRHTQPTLRDDASATAPRSASAFDATTATNAHSPEMTEDFLDDVQVAFGYLKHH